MELVTESLHEIVRAPIANASNTNVTSSSLDMAGFDCALFVVAISDSTDTAKAELEVEGSDDNATWKKLVLDEISATAAAADGLNGKILRVEVKRPLQRYLRARLKSTVANIAFGQTHGLRYAPRKVPPGGSDDVLAEVVVASPALT